MPIDLMCPECGASLEAPDELSGKKGTCPHCLQVIPVAAAEAESAAAPAAEAEAPAPAEEAAGEESAPEPEAAETPTAEAPAQEAAAPMKEAAAPEQAKVSGEGQKKKFVFKCPHCSQQMAAGAHRLGTAVKCPKCKQEFKLPASV